MNECISIPLDWVGLAGQGYTFKLNSLFRLMISAIWIRCDTSSISLSLNVQLYRLQFSIVTISSLQATLFPEKDPTMLLEEGGAKLLKPISCLAFACPEERAGPTLFKLSGRLRSLSLSLIMISGNFYSLDLFREIFHRHFMCSADSCARVFSNSLQIETLHLLNLCLLWIWRNCWGLVLADYLSFVELYFVGQFSG